MGAMPFLPPNTGTLKRSLIGASLVAALVAAPVAAGVTDARAGVPPLDDFSPAFLGMYRKVMEIEDDIRVHAERYGVDFDLARAVCLYESGGNPGLASNAGALGYFQVMPATYRELGVTTNIEAGVKYLAQMIRQFEREDRAIAAYNGGPSRVGRSGGLPLETLQYVMGVGHYRNVLKQYDEALRLHASSLRLERARAGDDWHAIASRVRTPEWELRLHNAFLAGRRLNAGDTIAYPSESRAGLFTPVDGGAAYRVRLGDNYIKLAIILGVDLEQFRSANGLWQLQVVPPGMVLRIPFSIDRANVIRAAVDTLPAPAQTTASTTATTAAKTTLRTHLVKRGDTLTGIARRYGTTVTAIKKANRLDRSTIQAGQTLRIPGNTRT
jgi:LysM repeat protein